MRLWGPSGTIREVVFRGRVRLGAEWDSLGGSFKGVDETMGAEGKYLGGTFKDAGELL